MRHCGPGGKADDESTFQPVVDSHAHFWDLTAINALDKIVLKYRRDGTEVELLGLGVGIEDAVATGGLDHHHDRVPQPEVTPHLGVEADCRIAGRDQGVAVRPEL
mgnify:CR=1 FL=1